MGVRVPPPIFTWVWTGRGAGGAGGGATGNYGRSCEEG